MEKVAAAVGANLLRGLAKHVNMGPASAAASMVRGGQSATALDTFQPFMSAMTTGLPGGAQKNWRPLMSFAQNYAQRNPQAATNPAALQNFAKAWSVRRQSLMNSIKNPGAMSGVRPAAPATPQPATQVAPPQMPVNRVRSMQPETVMM